MMSTKEMQEIDRMMDENMHSLWKELIKKTIKPSRIIFAIFLVILVPIVTMFFYSLNGFVNFMLLVVGVALFTIAFSMVFDIDSGDGDAKEDGKEKSKVKE